MKELTCPNCNTIIHVNDSVRDVICERCLASTGKTFIMIESSDIKKAKNLGDGFFERVEND